MSLRIRGAAARPLQALLDAGAMGSLDDRELVGRFLEGGDSAGLAFSTLVDRHGRMVFRICRDVLGDPHEAQDAAQATFFLLARKAGAIRKPEALPSWLHGTARRVASRALRDSIRRRRVERRGAEVAGARPDPVEGWPELHEELARLPDRYREPIILCDLQGLTHEQAAGRLCCPPRTLETRLYRGRERLKGRLIRRGLAPSAGLVGIARASEAQATPTPAWVQSTVDASVRLTGQAGWAGLGRVPSLASTLAWDHSREMGMTKVKLLLASGLAIGLAWQLRPASPASGQSQTKPIAENATNPIPQDFTPKPPVNKDLPASNTFPLTLSGIASDPEGRPIAGARVYLASRRADYKRLAETTTDAGGRYEFRDVPLPIEKADTFTGQDFGVFQVFAEAKGFGFAWRIEKWFYPRPVPPTYDVSNLYQAGDKIRLDLEFTVAARLAGTIVDDRGKPLPDIRLEIRDCETGILGEGKPLLPFATLNERNSAPASMKIRTTDAEGRFEFLDLPADCRFRISVSGQGFPIRWIYAATTDGLQPEYDGVPVLTGDINLTLATPLDIPIKLVFADNGRPAPDVAVQAVEGYVSDFKSSDAEGLATLRLPRGKYRMEDWPARGTPYLVTEAELVVGDAPPAEPIVRTLRPAAILEITVVDESTGEGLPDVDLWREVNGQRDRIVVRSWEVATRIARRDSPRTDARGKVRVFIEPGKHLVGIGLNALPGGYGDIDVEGREVDCREGQTTSLKFSLRKHVK